jgi:hypothetical protein
MPKFGTNEKIDESLDENSKERVEKREDNIKAYINTLKPRKHDRKRTSASPHDKNSFISSSLCLPHHKIITNSKIDPKILIELYSKYKPLNDNIQVEDVQLCYGEGVEYSGEWNKLRGERHGRGILIINNEKIYFGYWKHDKMNGLGKQIYCELNIENINDIDIFSENKKYFYYIGEWKDNYKEGKGKEFWPDGTSYEGEYKRGKKCGEGRLQLPDGSIYAGQFKDGEINGKGKIIYSDKREYEGDWVNNKFNGKGVFTWPDGRKYTGEYSNNLKDGYGVFEWPNGKKYKGKWTKGKQDEEGEIYDPSINKWISGKWYMGKKVKSNM